MAVQSLKVDGFISAYFPSYNGPEEPPTFEFNRFEPKGESWVTICPVNFNAVFDVPKDFMPARIKAIMDEKTKVNLSAAERIAELDDQLATLLAIGHTA